MNVWGKRFKLPQPTHESFLALHDSCKVFLISAKLNFHRPLVSSTICRVQYYTPEVGGSSVWQISKKYFAGEIYRQKALMCWLWQLETFSPYIHYAQEHRGRTQRFVPTIFCPMTIQVLRCFKDAKNIIFINEQIHC